MENSNLIESCNLMKSKQKTDESMNSNQHVNERVLHLLQCISNANHAFRLSFAVVRPQML